MTAYSLNAQPRLNDSSVGGLYAAAKRRAIQTSGAGHSLERAKQWIHDRKRRSCPFYSLSIAQHFYEEGLRFYHHPSAERLLISSESPGLLIPEEYYGEDIYFPGITRVVPPGTLYALQGIAFENWRYLLRTALFSGKKIGNPFRTIYFDQGLAACSKPMTYGIFWANARAELHTRIGRWSDQGLADEYLDDVASVARYFMGKPNLDISLLPDSIERKYLTAYTLLSEGYWFVSERQNRKIRRGRVFNVSVIQHIFKDLGAAGVPLLSSLAGVIEAIEGLAAGELAGMLAGRLIGRVLKNARAEMHGLDLKQHIVQRYGVVDTNTIRCWVEREVM